MLLMRCLNKSLVSYVGAIFAISNRAISIKKTHFYKFEIIDQLLCGNCIP